MLFKRYPNETGSLTLPDFKAYYKTTGTKTVWYWHKDKHTDHETE
jgi:hypothetical protein